jgi:hypothetical protein
LSIAEIDRDHLRRAVVVSFNMHDRLRGAAAVGSACPLVKRILWTRECEDIVRVVVIAAVLLFLWSGCTSTQMVGGEGERSEKTQLTYSEVQDELRGKTVRVILMNGQQLSGTIGGIASDSVRLWNDYGTEYVAIPTHEVRGVEKTDRGVGGVGGLLAGTFGGFLVGGALGEVLTPQGGDMRGLGVALYAVGGACVGAVAGTVYGVSHGLISFYQFQGESVVTGTP